MIITATQRISFARLGQGLAIIAFALGLSAVPALAGSSAWSDGMGARLRLIAQGGAQPAGDYLAGVHIDLQEGWKTYWRSPGDTGIPPQFDFSGSVNVSSVKVLYPVPKRDSDGYSTALVYKSDVVFPLRITPSRIGAPVVLKLKAVYGACENICVPETASATMFFSAASATDLLATKLIDQALRSVPGARTTAQKERGLGVRAVTFDRQKRRLDIEVAHLANGKQVDLFVEGPSNWYLGVPEIVAGTQKPVRFKLSLGSIPKNAKVTGTLLTFTVVDGKGAFEQTWLVK